MADDIEHLGGDVLLGREVTRIEERGSRRVLGTREGEEVDTALVVACAGLQADRVAALTGTSSRDYRIAPFRGGFFSLAPDARPLVKGMIYPVPDPSFPFLGVHFTRRIDGEVWAGPNAVPALAREGYERMNLNVRDTRDLLGYRGTWRLALRYARTGAGEIWRDAVKTAAVREMQRYLPELEGRHVLRGRAGMRAQVVTKEGSLVDDFLIERDSAAVHVVNAPSPAATASLAIADWIVRDLVDA